MNDDEVQKCIRMTKRYLEKLAAFGIVVPSILSYKNGNFEVLPATPQNEEDCLREIESLRRDHECIVFSTCGLMTVCEEDERLPISSEYMEVMEQTTAGIIVYIFLSDRMMSTYRQIGEDGEFIGGWSDINSVLTTETTFNSENVRTVK